MKKSNFSNIILLIIFFIIGFLMTIGFYYQNLLKSKIYLDSIIVNNLGKIRGGIQRYTKFKILNITKENIKNQINNEFITITSIFQKQKQILPYECKKEFFSYLNNLNSIWIQIQNEKDKNKLILLSEKAWKKSEQLINKFENIHKYKFNKIIKDIDYFITFSVVFLIILIVITYTKIKKGLEIETIRDALTKTHNRFYFDKIYNYLINLYKRNKTPFSMLIIDIDNFKKINDTYGHEQGDKILAELGKLLKDNVRKVDFVFRYGGEEFIILFPQTKLEKAKSIAQRILKKVPEKIKIDNKPITFSGGIGEYKGENEKDFFEKVDSALYKSKLNGKNRISVVN